MIKRIFNDHPILGGSIGLALSALFCFEGADLVVMLLKAVGFITEKVDIVAGIVTYAIVILISLVCLFVFTLLSKKEGFTGTIHHRTTDLDRDHACTCCVQTGVRSAALCSGLHFASQKAEADYR